MHSKFLQRGMRNLFNQKIYTPKFKIKHQICRRVTKSRPNDPDFDPTRRIDGSGWAHDPPYKFLLFTIQSITLHSECLHSYFQKKCEVSKSAFSIGPPTLPSLICQKKKAFLSQRNTYLNTSDSKVAGQLKLLWFLDNQQP